MSADQPDEDAYELVTVVQVAAAAQLGERGGRRRARPSRPAKLARREPSPADWFSGEASGAEVAAHLAATRAEILDGAHLQELLGEVVCHAARYGRGCEL